MTAACDLAEVECTIRAVTDKHVLSRFGRLTDDQVATKPDGQVVTVADLAVEQALGDRLLRILPNSTIVGEEAVSADPAVINALADPKPVWIVDPIDGTANFMIGNPRFTTLVALVQHGNVLASWTYAPALGYMATAVAGGGACLNGQRINVVAHGDASPLSDVAVAQPH